MATTPQELLDNIFTFIARQLELDPKHIVKIYQKSNAPQDVTRSQWGAQYMKNTGNLGHMHPTHEWMDDAGNAGIYNIIQEYWITIKGEGDTNEDNAFSGISNVVTNGHGGVVGVDAADWTWPAYDIGEGQWQALIVIGILNGKPFTGRVEENGDLVEMVDGEEIDMGNDLYFVAGAWDDEDEEEDGDPEEDN